MPSILENIEHIQCLSLQKFLEYEYVIMTVFQEFKFSICLTKVIKIIQKVYIVQRRGSISWLNLLDSGLYV